jgi:hypothetical protein
VGTSHNISPRLRKQLVLELEVRVEAFEVIKELPGSFFLEQAMPLDKDLPDALPELSTEGTLGSRKKSTI